MRGGRLRIGRFSKNVFSQALFFGRIPSVPLVRAGA